MLIPNSPPGGRATATQVIYAPTAISSIYTTGKLSDLLHGLKLIILAMPAEPTQAGTVSDCGLYYNVVSGDTVSIYPKRVSIDSNDMFQCNSIALRL
jgi:hypothetical protein